MGERGGKVIDLHSLAIVDAKPLERMKLFVLLVDDALGNVVV